MIAKLKNYRMIYTSVVLFIVILMACASSQQFLNQRRIPIRVKLFNLTSDSIGLSRLTIVASVAYEKIQFVKQGGQYHGEYFVSLEITDTDDNVIKLRDLTQKITLDDYKSTVKSTPLYNWLGFYDLPPKTYNIKIKLVDINSKSQGDYTRQITLKDYGEKPITSSHVIFTRKRLIDLPNLDYVLFDFSGEIPDSLFAYIELFQKKSLQEDINIKYEVRDATQNLLQMRSGTIHLSDQRQPIFLQLDIKKLAAGMNFLSIKYDYLGNKYSVETKFYVNWGKLQQSDSDIQLSLKQLRIIANPKDIKRIEKAPEAKQDSLLKLYWKERDPTPETEENELYDEFVRRIREANKMFSFQRNDGWRTDRGMIYLKYGPPDMIEKDIASRSGFGRYEIWIYEELRRRFIFYDRLGVGEYRLTSSM